MVSIIIPTYNTAAYIVEALQSVFAQTFRDYEILVLNDDSPDTPELERALVPFMDRIRYFALPHGGAAAARNHGIHQARGELVAFLDSDDTWLPNYLEVMVGMLENDPTLDVVYPDAVMFGTPALEGRLFSEMFPSEGDANFASMVRRRCCVFAQVTARRAALVRAGLFDLNMPCCEDFDLWIRAMKTGSRFGYTREVLVRYRRHLSSLSGNTLKNLRYVIYSLDKVRNTYVLTDDEADAVRASLSSLHATVALYEGKAAVMRRDYDLAIKKLTMAYTHHKNIKTQFAITSLKLIPDLLRLMLSGRSLLGGPVVCE